jgi:predicted enzyme related to lactoylglutathione lyase
LHRWYGVTIDCHNPDALATFWGRLLGLRRTTELDGEGWACLGTRDGLAPRLTFQKVDEPKLAKVRLHLDIEVTDVDAARCEIEGLGGGWVGIRHNYDEGIVMTMHDPEGHEFCITQFADRESLGRGVATSADHQAPPTPA